MFNMMRSDNPPCSSNSLFGDTYTNMYNVLDSGSSSSFGSSLSIGEGEKKYLQPTIGTTITTHTKDKGKQHLESSPYVKHVCFI